MKIFITGMPEIGKTMVMQKVMEILKEKELKIGGIYCPEIRFNDIRVGFEIIDLLNGNRGILSNVSQSNGPRVSRYRVNLQELSNIGVEP